MGGELYKAIAARDRRIADLIGLIDAGENRLMLVGPELELREAGAIARAVVDGGDGIALLAGRLMLADEACEAALLQAVRATIAQAPPPYTTFLCARPSGAPPWRLRVLPTGRDEARACMIAIDGAAAPQGPLAWLRGHYGASAAEADVALTLLAGLSPEVIATTRRVSLHTVRAQIKRLQDKTDTHSTAALVALLARLP